MVFWDVHAIRLAGQHGSDVCRAERALGVEGAPGGHCYAPIITRRLLRTHGQHYAKSCAAADHPVVSFGGLFQRILFDHRTDSGERAELHGVFGISGDPGGPSLESAAANDQLNGRNREWVATGAYDDEFAVPGKATRQRGHGFGIGRSGEDYAGAAEFLQFRGRIAGGGIHIVSRPEFSRQRFFIFIFVFAAADGDGAESHLFCILDSQMAEASYALNGDEIAGTRARVAQRIENRNAGTQQWRGIGGGQVVGDGGYRFGGRDHVFLVAAVVTDAGDFFVLAVNEIAAAAGVAGEVMATVPSDSDALAGFPVGYIGTDSVDAAGDFVAGDAWVLEAGPMAFLY